MTIEDKFEFGIHKGNTLQYVIDHDITYVGWCLNNVKKFTIKPKKLKDEVIAKLTEQGFKVIIKTKKTNKQ